MKMHIVERVGLMKECQMMITVQFAEMEGNCFVVILAQECFICNVMCQH